MRSYIKASYTGNQLILSRAAAEMLNTFEPKGCPFQNYTLLDLLKDLYEMYSWRIQQDMSVMDFIEMLKEFSNKAQAYGDEMILILKAFD